jgi:hypothetical protein
MTAFADCLLALRPFAEEWRDGDPANGPKRLLRRRLDTGERRGSMRTG